MNELLSFDIAAAFSVGLFGSLHCAGMCGPLVAVSCQTSGVARNGVSAALFLLGKFLAYGALGWVVGWSGSWLIDQQWLSRGSAWLSLVGGGVMIALLITPYILRKTTRPIGARFFKRLYSMQFPPHMVWLKTMLLGGAAILLPCGLLYSMVNLSASSGDAVSGMLILGAFSLGTSPLLLGIGLLLKSIPQHWLRHGSKLSEALLLVMAVVMIYRGWIGLTAEQGAMNCH